MKRLISKARLINSNRGGYAVNSFEELLFVSHSPAATCRLSVTTAPRIIPTAKTHYVHETGSNNLIRHPFYGKSTPAAIVRLNGTEPRTVFFLVASSSVKSVRASHFIYRARRW